jgi:hypothetical protein
MLRETSDVGAGQLLFAVGFDVVLGCVLGVLCRVRVMAVGQVRVVRGGFMVAAGVMLGGFVVVTGSVLVMIRCLGVMMSGLLGHDSPRVPGDVPARMDYLQTAQEVVLQESEMGMKIRMHAPQPG